jgi:hypothetical protein
MFVVAHGGIDEEREEDRAIQGSPITKRRTLAG